MSDETEDEGKTGDPGRSDYQEDPHGNGEELDPDGAAPEPNGQRADRRAVVPGHVMPDGPIREEDEPVRDRISDETDRDLPEPGETPEPTRGYVGEVD